MENLEDQRGVEKAMKKVKSIKGFYKHLAVYIIINILLIAMHWRDLEPGEEFLSFATFSTAIFWGFGLAIHAFGVFGTDVFFGSDWEDRKIREIMDKDGGSKEKWE